MNSNLQSPNSVNSILTKFLKRYLGVPYNTSNAIIYHITDLKPLTCFLGELCHERTGNLLFPESLDGLQLSLFNRLPVIDWNKKEEIWEKVPTYFWRSRQILSIPVNDRYRRKVCREICDCSHFEHCKNSTFHVYNIDCICKYCGDNLHPYHITYNFCTEV